MTSPPVNLGEALGGPWGIAESALPAVAFVTAYTATGQDLGASAAIAVGLAVVFAIARIIRRQAPWRAAAGAVGVGFAAFVAVKSGEARNYFLPGLVGNVALFAGAAGSALVRRPIVGYAVAQFEGGRFDESRRRIFTIATWGWAVLFLFRLAVQVPLYVADAPTALGVARTAMGIPLFAAGLALTYLIVRGPEDRRTTE